MSANSQLMNRFPHWEQAWKDSLPEVDEQISEFCKSCAGEPVQYLPELQEHITNWFEDQDLDEETLAELEKVKADPDYLSNQIGGRLSYLKQHGLLEPRGIQTSAGASNARPIGTLKR